MTKTVVLLIHKNYSNYVCNYFCVNSFTDICTRFIAIQTGNMDTVATNVTFRYTEILVYGIYNVLLIWRNRKIYIHTYKYSFSWIE